MTERDQPQVDTGPSEHEQRVLEESGEGRAEDPTQDPGRRPSSDEDLAADRGLDPEDRDAS